MIKIVEDNNINYAKIIAALYFALFIFLFLVMNIACRIVGTSVFSVIRAIREPALLAFTTATSEAALPQAMKIMENYGVPKNIVGFVSQNMNIIHNLLNISLC